MTIHTRINELENAFSIIGQHLPALLNDYKAATKRIKAFENHFSMIKNMNIDEPQAEPVKKTVAANAHQPKATVRTVSPKGKRRNESVYPDSLFKNALTSEFEHVETIEARLEPKPSHNTVVNRLRKLAINPKSGVKMDGLTFARKGK